jgi:methionine-rich copper-binding protein CopC
MAVGIRGTMTVDWIALTLGIIGAGAAIIALMIMLERDTATSHDCVVHADQAEGAVTDVACPE